uniref:Uncharacterized protein n=1 Tax=Romanomermis culicivorax TaxID=13658 RepID=A0A915HS67_ROMCU
MTYVQARIDQMRNFLLKQKSERRVKAVNRSVDANQTYLVGNLPRVERSSEPLPWNKRPF